jgi:hypothetical protein
MLTKLPDFTNQLTKSEDPGYTEKQLSGVIKTLIAGGAKKNRDFIIKDDIKHPGKSVIFINYEAHQPEENITSTNDTKTSPTYKTCMVAKG